MLTETFHTTLHNYLKLSKKSATWVNQLLYEKMKEEQVRICETFIVIIVATPSPSWTTYSLLVSRAGMKSKLAGLALTQEAL
jgi:hypothetical protein